MAQEIYNEGRVVGLSAWELFMRDALSNGVPPEDIPNEEKWLSSMIGSGASMILKIPANTTAGVHDYALPQGSDLAAAGVIIANPFMGSCTWNSGWADKVTSYSPLIQNTSTSYPTSSTIPYDATYSEFEYGATVSEFLKITDGIVYTNKATWIDAAATPPEKDIDPNFNESSAVIRLFFTKDTTQDIQILFTGFINKRILQAFSGFATEDGGVTTGGSADVNNNDWKNGGMLGPEVMPWASKIVFSVPSSAYNLAVSIERRLPSDTTGNIDGTHLGYTFKDTDTTIKSHSLVDFNSINLTDYYNLHTFNATPTLNENVSNISLGLNDSCSNVVAWYPGMSVSKILDASTSADEFFPPALYAAQITTTGSQTLVPLDVAAPGTVKYFQDSSIAYKYKQLLPDNCAIYHNTTNNTFSFVINNESNPNNWASTVRLEYYNPEPRARLVLGNTQVRFIPLNAPDGTPYTTAGSSGALAVGPSSNLVWDNLLNALKDNKAIDVLGTKLHQVGSELTATNTVGVANTIDEIGATEFTLKPGTTSEVGITSTLGSDSVKYVQLDNGSTVELGKDFITFGNGLRLYISDTEPTDSAVDIPIGSIGIGW